MLEKKVTEILKFRVGGAVVENTTTTRAMLNFLKQVFDPYRNAS